jgi:hypothetical protein
VQDDSYIPTPDSVLTEMTLTITPDVRADAISSSDPNKQLAALGTEPLSQVASRPCSMQCHAREFCLWSSFVVLILWFSLHDSRFVVVICGSQLSELVGAPVSSASATPATDVYAAPTKVFDDSKAYLSTAAWAGIICGAVAFLALTAVVTFIVVRKRGPAPMPSQMPTEV